MRAAVKPRAPLQTSAPLLFLFFAHRQQHAARHQKQVLLLLLRW